MRLLTLIILFISFQGSAQVKLKSVSSIDSTGTYKILLISADWCSICKKSKFLIENSIKIDSITKSDIKFYAFNVEEQNKIQFNNFTYHYLPNGIDSGQHEFTLFLFESKVPKIPTFIIFDKNNNEIVRYNTYLNEDDWVQLLSSLRGD